MFFTLVLALIALVGLYFVFAERLYTIFRSSSKPPLVYGYPVVGSAIEYAMDMKKFFEKYHKKHGSVFEMKIMGFNWVLFSKVEHLRQIYKVSEDVKVSLPLALLDLRFDVFLGMEGLNPFHATLIKTQLTPNRVSATPFIEEAAKADLQKLAAGFPSGKIVLEKPFLWAVDIASRATLRSIAGSDIGNNPELLKAFADFIGDIESFLRWVVLIPYKVSERKKELFDKHYKKLHSLVLPAIKKKRENFNKATSGEVSSFHQSQLATKDDIMLSNLFNSRNHEGEMFTDEQLATLIVQTAWASVVTTGDAMISLLYDVCQHQNVQSSIFEDMRKETGPQLLFSEHNIENMKYLEATIKESLRTSNLEVRCQRKVTQDITVGGYHIKKGQTVGMSVYPLHYDNDRFPNADQFLPERFLSSEKTSGEPLFTFGMGRHECPGRYYSIHVVKTILCVILRDYEISFADPNAQRPPFTVVPLDVPIQFKKRTLRQRSLTM